MILFDITVPQRVLFFKNILKKLKKRDISFIVTTREGDGYKEVIELLKLYDVESLSFGGYGKSLEEKLKISSYRQQKLIDVIKKYNVKTIVSGSVVDASRVGFGLGLKVVNFNDLPLKNHKFNYKDITPVTKLTVPLSTVLFKPFVIPDDIFLKLGIDNIKTYNFIDPYIWLKDLKPSIEYVKEVLPEIDFSKPIVVVREEEFYANYVDKKNDYFYEAIKEIEKWNLNLIIIPRYEREKLTKIFKNSIVLQRSIELQHLLAFSNLFIGGGGTINIEAAFFGIPVISTRSFISHYDKFLIDNGLMYHANDKKGILNLSKKLIHQSNKQKAKEVFSNMEIDLDLFVKELV